jgi:hypothetical protein
MTDPIDRSRIERAIDSPPKVERVNKGRTRALSDQFVKSR